MAAKKGSANETTRRGFLAAVVGVGAAALVPAGAAAALPARGGKAPGGIWQVVAGMAEWYGSQLEQFAEELRPDFASGKFRGHRDSDFPEDELAPGTGWTGFADLPFRRLELHAGERFGLSLDEDGDNSMAHLILAVSPNVDRIDPGSAPCGHAAEAVALDVLALAAARGWYTPARDEEHLGELETLPA